MSNPEEVTTDQDELPGMPEEDEFAPLLDWLKRKWGADGVQCPYCGATQWVMGRPIQLAYGNTPEPGLYYVDEMFPVSCTNCGNTAFVNRSATELDLPEQEEVSE